MIYEIHVWQGNPEEELSKVVGSYNSLVESINAANVYFKKHPNSTIDVINTETGYADYWLPQGKSEPIPKTHLEQIADDYTYYYGTND